MKILFIGYYKEPTGWGFCAREELKFLSKHFDVVARPVEFTSKVRESWMESVENKSLDGVTHVIQHLLPQHFERFPGVKNIGYVEIESSNLKYSMFPDHFSIMDEIWVVNEDAKKAVEDCCKIPTRVVHHPLNFDINKKEYKKINIPEVQGNFVFYNISEDVPRKNLGTLITAFHAEFDPTEPVSLVIKTNHNIDGMIAHIKKQMRLYKTINEYRKDVVITDRVSDDQIYGVHSSGHCFVMPSCGESWCQPMMDAAVFQNQIIGPNFGPVKLLNNVIHCDYDRKYCIGNNNFLNYQNVWDTWNSVNECSLGDSMRIAYTKGKVSQEYDLSHFRDEFKIKSMCLEKELE